MSYFPDVINRPSKVINRVCSIIRKDFPDCKGVITADGLSGSLILVPVALRLNVPFAVVRIKKSSHSDNVVEGPRTMTNFVFIDDFIEKGKTIKNVLQTLDRNTYYNYSPFLGVVLYGSENKVSCKDYKKRTFILNEECSLVDTEEYNKPIKVVRLFGSKQDADCLIENTKLNFDNEDEDEDV